MTRETIEQKAARYVVAGRLMIDRVDEQGVRARVRGSGEVYDVVFADGAWSCSCPARVARCAHVAAAQLVVAIVAVALAGEPDPEPQLADGPAEEPSLFGASVSAGSSEIDGEVGEGKAAASWRSRRSSPGSVWDELGQVDVEPELL